MSISACTVASTAARNSLPQPETDLVAQAEPTGERHAVFAGGCFWCTEGVFERVDGVTAVVSGYAGGTAESATYEQVSMGRTDHAEAIRITYHPEQVRYGTLLRIFFSTHDPTQLNRQGPDVGAQYRSAVFYQDEAEMKTAAAYIKQLEQAGIYERPIATTLEPLQAFYPAEDYHQDFVQRNPNHPYVERYAWPKIDKLRKLFPDSSHSK